MIDEDRTTWTLGQLADEVIEACELPMGCRGTIIAALADAKAQGRAASTDYAGLLVEDVRTVLRGFDEEVFIRDVAHDGESAWAMKLIPYMQALGRLAANVNPETMPPGERARTEIVSTKELHGRPTMAKNQLARFTDAEINAEFKRRNPPPPNPQAPTMKEKDHG